MEYAQQVELTKFELLYLDDNLTLLSLDYVTSGQLALEESTTQSLRGIAANALTAVGRETLLKLGGALLECELHGHNVFVSLTEKELWLLRECAHSAARMGRSEEVGYSLKFKIYSALQKIELEKVVGKGDNESREPEIDLSGKLEEWKNASANESANPQENNQP